MLADIIEILSGRLFLRIDKAADEIRVKKINGSSGECRYERTQRTEKEDTQPRTADQEG